VIVRKPFKAKKQKTTKKSGGRREGIVGEEKGEGGRRDI
jgi:hypothetical protein